MLELSGRYRFGLLHGLSLGVAPSMLLAFLMLDAWQYAWHVINHRIPLLWRFHAVHHSDGEMDASSAVRFHTGEVMLSHLARLAVLPLLGVTPLDLLIYESVMFPVILFHHSNLRIPERLDRGLRWVIVTPGMHWLHHSDEIRETNSNYASVFSLWDRLGRTYAVRRLPAEVSLGLKGLTRADWNSLGAALKLPFKRNRP
jgi:sterol desaturase/sphingolipid hydroxylase (fatty acid hydroxylase superfamily)